MSAQPAEPRREPAPEDVLFPRDLEAVIDEQLARFADPEMTECDNCDGQGVLDTRHFGRHVADEWTSEICNRCGGTGEVRA